MNNFNFPQEIIAAAQAITNAGGRAYLVGGAVRDHVMGRGKPNRDWDIEVFGLTYDELLTVLNKIGKTKTVGKSFSVIKTTIAGYECDFSLPRRERKTREETRAWALLLYRKYFGRSFRRCEGRV